MLPYGTADMITGGVFIVYGVKANRVEHFGEVVTYGVNDMVLDTWAAWRHGSRMRRWSPTVLAA
jgi:hypothetical protein